MKTKFNEFLNEGNLKPVDILLLNKRKDTTYKIIKEPLMVGYNIWWFVIKDMYDYVFDVSVTSKELYDLYGDITGLTFDDFITKAKAGELNLKNITI